MFTQAMLEEARRAYHALMTGTQATQARGVDGREVRWTASNVTQLRAYINQIETALGLPTTGWTGTARTPARRVLF